MFVQGNKKRGPIPLKGREAIVVRVLGKGTVLLQAPGYQDAATRLQQKYALSSSFCIATTLSAQRHGWANNRDS